MADLGAIQQLTMQSMQTLNPGPVVGYAHRLAGTVTEDGVASPHRRVVVLDRVTLQYVGSKRCNPDGTWELTHLADRAGNPNKLLVIAFDDDGTAPNYNAVVADQVEQVS
jgi:hypothetical protein